MSQLFIRACLLALSLSASLVACTSPPDLPAPDSRSHLKEEPSLAQMGLLYDDTIVTQSGRTVDFNGQAFIPRSVHVSKSGGGSDLDVDLSIANIVFGLNRDLTLKVGIPYITKRLDRPGALSTLNSGGFGDTLVSAKYRFFQKTGIAETTEAAVIFGVELPTGRDDVRDAGTLLPAPLQPGSGSVDALLGAAITRVDGRWLGSADLIAKLNSQANDYRFGNVLRADFGGQFRLLPIHYEHFDQLTVNLVAELNSSWSERDRLGGAEVANSGGFRLFATPGVQVIFNRFFLLEAAVQIPLALELNGPQLEEDFVSIIGFRFRF